MSVQSHMLVLFLPILTLGCSHTDARKEEDTDASEEPDPCDVTTARFPADGTVMGLAAAADGTIWAGGDAYTWWRDEGSGWREVEALQGDGGPLLAEAGGVLWAGTETGLMYTTGDGWVDQELDLAGSENLKDLVGLGDGRIAVASNEQQYECEEGCEDRLVLRVGDRGGFATTDLGWGALHLQAIGSDGAGGALAAGLDSAWLFDGADWSAITLPVEGYWVDILGFDGEWVLASADGLLLRGAPDDWRTETVDAYLGLLAGEAADDLWLVTYDSETGEQALLHDAGGGWAPVEGLEFQAAAAVVAGGDLVIGGQGPAIARGDVSGVATEWTSAQVVGEGAAWSSADGRVYLGQSTGALAVYADGGWTELAQVEASPADVGDAGFVAVDGRDGFVAALTRAGSLLTWDGVELTRDDTLSTEDRSFHALRLTEDGVPVAAGSEISDDQAFTLLLEARVDGEWVALDPPPAEHMYALLAPSLDELVMYTEQGLYRWDGVSWTAVDGLSSWVSDLARTEDGRVWVATDGSGLFELVDGALQAVEGSPPRIDLLLAWGDVVFGAAYDLDAHTASVHRYDGDWTELMRPSDAGALLAVEGGDTLWAIEYAQITMVCLDP